MKIAHFSDTHLGYSEGTKTNENGLNLREADVYNAFTEVVDKITEIKPGLIIHSGDLFDNSRPTNKAINFVLKEIKRISKLGIPFVLISGNHSTPRTRTSSSIFEAFSLFDNIYPVYKLEYKEIKLKSASIHCIPHMLTEQEMQKSFNNVKPNPKSDINILVAHVGISAEKQYKMGEFNEQIIPYGSLAKKHDFNYIALGHYHKNIKLADNIYYSGSTKRFSFDDVGQDKGFIVMDTENDKKPVRFTPIAIREIVSIGPIDCISLTPREITEQIEKDTKGKIKEKTVLVTLTNLSRQKYIELDFLKLKEFTSEATYIKFNYQWAQEDGVKISQTSIGSLSTEFEVFLKKQRFKDLDKKRLKELGIEYLSKAILPE